MYLSQRVLVRHNKQVIEGTVIKIHPEELDIKLETGEIIKRKYWEIRKIPNENK